MAPLSDAVRTTVKSIQPDGSHVFDGELDIEWSYDGVVHGGYIIAMLTSAAVELQKNTSQRDPLQLSAHFISGVRVGPCTVRVQPIRRGKSFYNLRVELLQDDSLKITALYIFGTLGTAPASGEHHSLTLAPPDALARHVPLSMHPAHAEPTQKIPQARFARRMEWAFDPAPFARNRGRFLESKDQPSAHANLRTPGGEGVEWGAWYTLTDGTRLTTALLAFFADIFLRAPDLVRLAGEPSGGAHTLHAFTTLALSVEFKARLEPERMFTGRCSPHTVGLYSTGKFMTAGLHDGTVEIWTAPADIGKGTERDGWREEQVCLAVASQVAVAHPFRLVKEVPRHGEKPDSIANARAKL